MIGLQSDGSKLRCYGHKSKGPQLHMHPKSKAGLQVASGSGVAKNGDTQGGILWCHPLLCIVG